MQVDHIIVNRQGDRKGQSALDGRLLQQLMWAPFTSSGRVALWTTQDDRNPPNVSRLVIKGVHVKKKGTKCIMPNRSGDRLHPIPKASRSRCAYTLSEYIAGWWARSGMAIFGLGVDGDMGPRSPPAAIGDEIFTGKRVPLRDEPETALWGLYVDEDDRNEG